jgi:hypothetical protein
MPPVNEEPALRFWLRYAERQGALVEDHGDHALLVLPEALQRDSELPEEVTVTASPDIAREEGAALLIAGHPAVERAATVVLAEGDAGSTYLPWPASKSPARSQLESRARELVSVEHGRIDATGEPIAAYLPLLRLGALVSYAASLTLRFQEQEEVLLDARTGLEPSRRVLQAMRGRPCLERPDGRGRVLAPNLELAVMTAHEQLEQRARDREASLAVHARRALQSELARADAYYAATLHSIAGRRANAPPDRARLLEAQAKATEAERARRCREIEEEHRPRHEFRPFRMHLVHLPAYMLPVEVRRGGRAFAFGLTWIAVADEFVGARCPGCGAAEPLVATRERLGCRMCAGGTGGPRAAVGSPAATMSGPAPGPAVAWPAPDPEPVVARRAPDPEPENRQRHARRPGPPKPKDASPPAPASSPRGPSSAAIERTGNKLAYSFWRCVAAGDRWPRHKVPRDSPLRAVYRLYGNWGPQIAIGVPPGALLDKVVAVTHPTEAGVLELTVGAVTAGDDTYDYTIWWWLEAGKPVVGEVMPSPHPLVLPPVRGAHAELALRLHERAPAPLVELDSVSSAIWGAELRTSGLPFAVRCLTTWWRVRDRADPSLRSSAVAAVVAAAVARAGGVRRTRAEAARLYETDPELIASLEPELRGELHLDRRRGW